MTGLLRSVGYDGAFEVAENPAYLVLPRDKKPYAVAVDGNGTMSYKPDLNVLEKESLDGSYAANSMLAFSAADVLGGNLGFGAAAGSIGNPLVSRQKITGKSKGTTFDGETNTSRLAGVLGIAYKLNEENALGFSCYTQRADSSAKEVFQAIIDLPPVVQVTQNSLLKSQELTVAILLGYLSRVGSSELGISFVPAGWVKKNSEQKLSQRIQIPSLTYDVTEKFQEKYVTSNLLAPQLNGGVANDLFSFLRFYVDLGLTLPVPEIDRFGKYHNSKIIRFETEDTAGLQKSLSTGMALTLPAKWRLFAGYYYSQQDSDRAYKTSFADYYLLRKQSVILQQAQIGASYLFRDNLALILGTQTTHLQVDQQDTELEAGLAKASSLKIKFFDSGLYLALHYNPG